MKSEWKWYRPVKDRFACDLPNAESLVVAKSTKGRWGFTSYRSGKKGTLIPWVRKFSTPEEAIIAAEVWYKKSWESALKGNK